MTHLAEKAYLTLDWKVKDDMILRRYIRGQPTDTQRILNVNHPMNLSMAVKTISRTHQFQLEATVTQHYSLNKVTMGICTNQGSNGLTGNQGTRRRYDKKEGRLIFDSPYISVKTLANTSESG